MSARPPDSKHPCTLMCSCLSTLNQWETAEAGASGVGPALPFVCSGTVSARSEQEMKTTVGISNRKRIIKGIRSLQNQGRAEHPRMTPRMNDNCLPGELP